MAAIMDRRTVFIAFAAVGTVGLLAVIANHRGTEAAPTTLETVVPERQSDSESSANNRRSVVALERETRPDPPPDTNASENEPAPSSAATPGESEAERLDRALIWLRGALPDKFARLTAAELAALKELDLQGAEITDEDLRLLADLSGLETLNLRGTSITDSGIAHIWNLDQLKSLELRGTKVTGSGLQNLPRNLEALVLTDTQVTGDDLIRLPPMAQLSTLKLNFLELQDPALEALAALPALRHLELDQSGITDAGARRLFELQPGLTRIEMRSTAVTEETLAELKAAYPGCEFVVE